MTTNTPRTILLTAFEPSGDALGAALIASLKEREPAMRFVAMGGPKMRDAGAEIIEETTEHAKMALSAVGEVNTHRRRLKVLADWLKNNDIAALVPIDSPAANWSVCGKVRKHRPNAKVVHLVCPQIWAWATWRIRRLRRLSDRVLCMLPFEPDWLGERGVEGVFVGHPVYEEAMPAAIDTQAMGLAWGDDVTCRLAIMPGSRCAELERNWPTMQRVFESLMKKTPGLRGLVAARSQNDADILRRISGELGGWPEGLEIVVDQTPSVLAWSEVVFVKSGTSTLQVASMRKPMAAFYNVSKKQWNLLGRWLVKTKTFALPNLISNWQAGAPTADRSGHVVPEFVPHFGAIDPLVEALYPLVSDGEKRAVQIASLDRIAEPYTGIHFGAASAESLLEMIG